MYVGKRNPETVRSERLCIVMACDSADEAAEVGRLIWQVNTGSLITYRRAEDLMFNSPSGKVALVILATGDSPQVIGRILSWLRHRWPRCPVAVIGNAGGGELEMTARTGGASYLARPVSPDQWAAMIQHVLNVPDRITGNKLG